MHKNGDRASVFVVIRSHIHCSRIKLIYIWLNLPAVTKCGPDEDGRATTRQPRNLANSCV